MAAKYYVLVIIALFSLQIEAKTMYLEESTIEDHFKNLIRQLRELIKEMIGSYLEKLEGVYKEAVVGSVTGVQKRMDDLEALNIRAVSEVTNAEKDPNSDQECVSRLKRNLKQTNENARDAMDKCFADNLSKLRVMNSDGKDSFTQHYDVIPDLEAKFSQCQDEICKVLVGGQVVRNGFEIEEKMEVSLNKATKDMNDAMPKYDDCLNGEYQKFATFALKVMDDIKTCITNEFY